MREANLYSVLGQALEQRAKGFDSDKHLMIGKTILKLREKAGLTGAELCRRSGSLDPRTLNAIERGRIRNPSLDSLQRIAKGLGCLVRDLFTHAEMEMDLNFYKGSPKGVFQIEFPKLGLKVVSVTPPNPHFFCGKVILAPKRKASGGLLANSSPVFIEVIMGRVEFSVEAEVVTLTEGENLFFNGGLRHSFRNLLNRESTLWLMTATSFFPWGPLHKVPRNRADI